MQAFHFREENLQITRPDTLTWVKKKKLLYAVYMLMASQHLQKHKFQEIDTSHFQTVIALWVY